MRQRARRRGVSGLAAGVICLLLVAAGGAPDLDESTACVPRLLVLGAMPLEVQPLLDAADLDPASTVEVDGRTFHQGVLAGQDVVLAMTGIGMVNAEQTVTAAFDHFTCGLSGVVFSGVAGSRRSIGDVAIPQRWTMDDGETWLAADPAMLQAARRLVGQVELARTVPTGDDACLCLGVDTLDTPVQLEHEPRLRIGGDGTSGDTYGDRALPCVPGGGDVFGCRPCLTPETTAADIADFASNAPDYADPAFLQGFFQPPDETTDTYEAQDMESAAAAAVAARHHVPFLAIRAASDGQGDPLNLPGFPFQFFAYRHLAGNNAAAVTIAFLDAWRGERA